MYLQYIIELKMQDDTGEKYEYLFWFLLKFAIITGFFSKYQALRLWLREIASNTYY